MSHFNGGQTEPHLRNAESVATSNPDLNSDASNAPFIKQHLVKQQKNGKRKGDMSLEEMYSSQFDFGDEEDEDDDSDWDPSDTILECQKWFCRNCTMPNIEEDDNEFCNGCLENRLSGILQRGYLACSLYPADDPRANENEVSHKRNTASDNLTAVGFDERMLLHEEVMLKPHPHPERPDRLRAIAASFAAAGIFPGRCHPIPAREITQEELLKVHSLENIEAVEDTSHVLSSYFTPDTYANQYSATAARLAAGLCFDLAAAICSGKVKNGFALVRPPGHHAGVKQAMGFCLHNNAAVAASAAQAAGAKKVLIIDWDVHHGNGTQEIFEKSKSVLYISLHRHEGGKFYPGTGSAHEIGSMGAEGYCVNIPWSRGGVGDDDYIFAFQQIVLPIAAEFDPDFTIISAGFDAARFDPLGGCDVSPIGYAQMTQMICALSGGKVLVILEGGYNLRSISVSATFVIKVLLGESPQESVDQVIPTKSGLRTVLEVQQIQLKYWPSLEPMFSKLHSEWGPYVLVKKKESKKEKKGGAKANAPIWWKWGRKRWLYRLSYRKKLS
ncbi:hypothetical protein ACS0TY_030590 [Phlomoides rotata]